MLKLAFIVPPNLELLDLAGPLQVFTEAKFIGLEVALEFYSYQENIISSSGLGLDKVAHFKEARLQPGDFVFIPGMDYEYIISDSFRSQKAFFGWLSACAQSRINAITNYR
jgi:transcriptional regulator GlxA family with amidase domain